MCYILMIYNAILILLFGGGENREACIDVVWWKVRGVEYLFISLHIFFFFFFFLKIYNLIYGIHMWFQRFNGGFRHFL
jgi:hypothetical protein